MNSGEPDPAVLVAALRSMRRRSLLALAVCAAGIAILGLTTTQHPDAPIDRRYPVSALGLAGLSILTRRGISGRASARTIVALHVTSCVGAVGLGLLGALLAAREGQAAVGLLYSAAGALLLVRPAEPFLLPRPPRPPRA
jgi:hypothetical protein